MKTKYLLFMGFVLFFLTFNVSGEDCSTITNETLCNTSYQILNDVYSNCYWNDSDCISETSSCIPQCNRFPLPVWESNGCSKLNETECSNWYELQMLFGFWIYDDSMYSQTAFNCYWNGTDCKRTSEVQCDFGQYGVSYFPYTTTTLCSFNITSGVSGIDVCDSEVCSQSLCLPNTQDAFISFRYSGVSRATTSNYNGVYVGVSFILSLALMFGVFGFVIIILIYILGSWWKK